jgi:hypothetical protein
VLLKLNVSKKNYIRFRFIAKPQNRKQIIVYATGLTDDDMGKAQVGIASL